MHGITYKFLFKCWTHSIAPVSECQVCLIYSLLDSSICSQIRVILLWYHISLLFTYFVNLPSLQIVLHLIAHESVNVHDHFTTHSPMATTRDDDECAKFHGPCSTNSRVTWVQSSVNRTHISANLYLFPIPCPFSLVSNIFFWVLVHGSVLNRFLFYYHFFFIFFIALKLIRAQHVYNNILQTASVASEKRGKGWEKRG